jgi:hypothetical protein
MFDPQDLPIAAFCARCGGEIYTVAVPRRDGWCCLRCAVLEEDAP